MEILTEEVGIVFLFGAQARRTALLRVKINTRYESYLKSKYGPQTTNGNLKSLKHCCQCSNCWVKQENGF